MIIVARLWGSDIKTGQLLVWRKALIQQGLCPVRNCESIDLSDMRAQTWEPL